MAKRSGGDCAGHANPPREPEAARIERAVSRSVADSSRFDGGAVGAVTLSARKNYCKCCSEFAASLGSVLLRELRARFPFRETG